MAVISLNIDDTILTRVIDGVCTHFNYQAKLPDGTDNPETKGQYTKRMVCQSVKAWVRESEVVAASQAAAATAGSDADTDIVIT